MDRKTQEQYINGSTLLLSNRYQIIGDRMSEDVTMKQWIMLIIINKIKDGELTINRLADFMGYSRQNATKMLLLLEKKGFVRLSVSKSDRRAKNVELTDKAYCFFKENDDIGNKLLDAAFAGISDEEVAAAFKIMMKLMENAAAMMEENNKNEANSGVQIEIWDREGLREMDSRGTRLRMQKRE